MAEDRPPARASMSPLVAIKNNPARQISLGSIPPPPKRSLRDRDPEELDHRLVLLREPDSRRAESFRSLRDNLIEQTAPRIMAVSSPSDFEGKTTTALNLALALAEEPQTLVLLIDANFFAPSLHHVFIPDVSESELATEVVPPQLSPYRIADVMPGLHVAVIVAEAGKPPPIFNRRKFETTIGRLSAAAYDFIVLDAPTLDGSATSTAIIGAAEGTIVTARAGVTTAQRLRKAMERIPKGRGLGVTLIDDDTPA